VTAHELEEHRLSVDPSAVHVGEGLAGPLEVAFGEVVAGLIEQEGRVIVAGVSEGHIVAAGLALVVGGIQGSVQAWVAVSVGLGLVVGDLTR
jgi:hypothetical protein